MLAWLLNPQVIALMNQYTIGVTMKLTTRNGTMLAKVFPFGVSEDYILSYALLQKQIKIHFQNQNPPHKDYRNFTFNIWSYMPSFSSSDVVYTITIFHHWALWHSRLWSFHRRDTKLERFLAKNHL